MTVLMIALMRDVTEEWRKEYLANVPAILADHGGAAVARSREITRIEGEDIPDPDRITIIKFPDELSARSFLADPRYAPYHRLRKEGARSDIFLFENALADGPLAASGGQ